MMFYVYTILVPLIIAMMLWFLVKPKRARKYVNYILLLIVILFFYALILYVLETNSYISEGWMTSATDRKSTRLNSSHVRISYAVFCLKKKKITTKVLLVMDESLVTKVALASFQLVDDDPITSILLT